VYSEQLRQDWVRIGEYNKEDKVLTEELQHCTSIAIVMLDAHMQKLSHHNTMEKYVVAIFLQKLQFILKIQ
jgi:hypothetical protein